MLKLSNFKNEIIGGIISSLIFLILLQPILNAFGKLLQFLGKNVYSGFSDALYRNAALGHRNYVDLFIYFTFMSVFLGFLTGPLINVYISKRVDKLAKKEGQLVRLQKTLMIMLILCVVVVVISLLSMGVIEYSDLQMNTSFEQRVMVLAPYLSEQQEEELRSSWALMKKRGDYEIINQSINSYAQQYSLELQHFSGNNPLLN